jgi:hypothetical protein
MTLITMAILSGYLKIIQMMEKAVELGVRGMLNLRSCARNLGYLLILIY